MRCNFSKIGINRVKGCQSCSWSAKQARCYFRCPRSCLRIWPRVTSSAVPSRVSALIVHTQAESDAYSRDLFRFPRRRQFMYLNRHTPSDQFMSGHTQLRTDGGHCRKHAGTGPVVLKVVRVTDASLSGLTLIGPPFFCALLFSTPIH